MATTIEIAPSVIEKARTAFHISSQMMWRSGYIDNQNNLVAPTEADRATLLQETAQLHDLLQDIGRSCTRHLERKLDHADHMVFMSMINPAIRVAQAMVEEIGKTQGGESLSRDNIRNQIGIIVNCLTKRWST